MRITPDPRCPAPLAAAPLAARRAFTVLRRIRPIRVVRVGGVGRGVRLTQQGARCHRRVWPEGGRRGGSPSSVASHGFGKFGVRLAKADAVKVAREILADAQ